MDIYFDTSSIGTYKSNSQIAKILSETWLANNLYCPQCSNASLKQFTANRKVADFHCLVCKEEYELKAENRRTIGTTIKGGAYSAMIERIQAVNNPNFFFLTYDKVRREDTFVYTVTNLIIIPKQFFVPAIIEKRRALSATARRAGWIGCNILLKTIPEQGRITIIKNQEIMPKDLVLSEWQKTRFLQQETLPTKGWLIDIMNCIEEVSTKEFSLSDIYVFEEMLQKKHPENKHIRDKIRQQLQLLRDKGYLRFTTRGNYQRV